MKLLFVALVICVYVGMSKASIDPASTGKLEVQEQVKEKEKEDTDPAAELFILEPVEQWKITLLIFSGSPDPVWTIQRQSQELFNAIKKLFSQAVKYEKVYKPSTVPLFLGFRGFFLQAGEEGPTFFITGSETKDLQVLLLRSIPEELVSKEVLDTVSEDIQKGKEIIMNEKLENSFTKRALNRRYDWFTKFIWNDDATRKRNNCYNYAVNTVTNTFAQPGRRRRNFNLELPLTGDIVMNAATVDGLRRPDVADGQPVASYAAVLGPNEYLVALVVHKRDFHWYRLDTGGRWSHKQGKTPISNTDNRSAFISDPRQAAMGRYRFVSFMIVNSNTVVIR